MKRESTHLGYFWHWASIRIILLAIAVLSFAPTGSTAPSSAWFTRQWQAEDGLPDNSVTGVAQAPDGYLWVGTHTGLTRFDGVRFLRMPLPGDSGGSLPLIRTMLVTKNATVWLALEGGTAMSVDSQSTRIVRNGLPNFRPLTMAQDETGAVWVGYVDGSACRIAGTNATRFTARDGLSGLGSCWVAADLRGRLWFGKGGRAGVFQDGTFKALVTLPDKTVRLVTARDGGMWACSGLRLFKITEGGQLTKLGDLKPEQPGAEPGVMYEDRLGALWIGTSASGMYRYDGTNITHVETSQGSVESIAEDREGNLWVGTGGDGLSRLRSRTVEFQGAATGLPFETVRSLCEDASGRLWAAAQNGGLVRYEGGEWKAVPTAEGWPEARASCVASDGEGGVWVGTQRGEGLYHWKGGSFTVMTREQGLRGDTVRGLFLDKDAGLWISQESITSLQRFHRGKLSSYAQPSGSRHVRTIVQDSGGNVWLGTADGFLLRAQGDVLVDETPRTLTRPRPIRCLYASPDGSLWIGYSGAGLGLIRNGKFSLVGIDNGLRDDHICAVMPDEQGAIWFTGDRGIFQSSYRELQAVAEGREKRLLSVHYGRDEGLPSLQGNYGYAPGALRSRDGRIWFPMRTGLAVVHPQRLQPNRIPPLVRIERVVMDGQRIEMPQAGGRLRVAPGHRKIELEFTALTFVDPENVQFRYQLKGWDDQWSEPSLHRTASFSRLPAGEYSFTVTACNSRGVWSQVGESLSFIVQPFVWQTWWFRLAATGVLSCVLVWVVRGYEQRRVRRQVQELERRNAIERERARIARDIHDDLGAGLAQIGLLADLGASQPADSDKVQATFSKIGVRARASVSALEEIVWAANPKNDTLRRLADFLSHLADECFEESPMRLLKEVPVDLPSVHIGAELRHNVALAVKEALANAMKHSQASIVWLKVAWQDPELIISIEDNGKGLSTEPEGDLADGLRNQSQRMKDIGGTVELQGGEAKGTRVTFCVNLTGQKTQTQN